LNYARLALLLIQERRKRGLTLAQVADECGVNISTLCRLENEKGRCDLDVFRRLCVWGGWSADNLMNLEPPPGIPFTLPRAEHELAVRLFRAYAVALSGSDEAQQHLETAAALERALHQVLREHDRKGRAA